MKNENENVKEKKLTEEETETVVGGFLNYDKPSPAKLCIRPDSQQPNTVPNIPLDEMKF